MTTLCLKDIVCFPFALHTFIFLTFITDLDSATNEELCTSTASFETHFMHQPCCHNPTSADVAKHESHQIFNSEVYPDSVKNDIAREAS